jgi:hypothetical protein
MSAGHDRVDRRHVGVVPGRDDEDHAVRLALDPALELIAVLVTIGASASAAMPAM